MSSERIVTCAGITTLSIPHLSNEFAPRKVRESGKLIADKKNNQKRRMSQYVKVAKEG
jgi:hypothetical protein